jgi:hypothetical protein
MTVTKSFGQNKTGVCSEESQGQIQRDILENNEIFFKYIYFWVCCYVQLKILLLIFGNFSLVLVPSLQ